jgi:hypothetical protein
MHLPFKQKQRFFEFRDRKHRIDKDVCRTDRRHEWFRDDDSRHLVALHDVLLTYTFFNFDLGYVQGMNDLLSPLLVSQKGDEVDAFWCFVGVMERQAPLFDKDQAGMTAQLDMLQHALRGAFSQLLYRLICFLTHTHIYVTSG